MECDGKPTDSVVVSGRSSLAGLMRETKDCVRIHLEGRAFDIATGFYEFHAGTLLLFVYAVAFIALLVLTGLSVFWFYLASMDDPLSFSWVSGCDDAVNSNSSYDLQMRVCYGVQDPIANPNPDLLRQIMDEAQ